MKKFIITEEEKKQILGLYEQGQPQKGYSQFTQDVAAMMGVVQEDVDFLESANESLSKEERSKYWNKYRDQFKNVIFSAAKAMRDGSIDGILQQLSAYNKQITENQRQFLNTLIDFFTMSKTQLAAVKTLPQDKWDEYFQAGGATDIYNFLKNTQSQTPDQTSQTGGGEKINTTNDRSYDYKLSNGKYYYSVKGQNNWVEAKGKGLESIKSKVKF